MAPATEPASHIPYPLGSASQTACYQPWLKARVLLRAALTMSWPPEAWAEVHAHLPWLLAEERRLRHLFLKEVG